MLNLFQSSLAQQHKNYDNYLNHVNITKPIPFSYSHKSSRNFASKINPLNANPRRMVEHSNNPSAICGRTAWMRLTILLVWHLNG